MKKETRIEPEIPEKFAWDIRTGRLFTFRRLVSYVLLRDYTTKNFVKTDPETFEEYFEGAPPPEAPFIKVVQ